MIGSGHELLFARQPICSPKGRALGYELLYRDVRTERALLVNPDAATAEVILNSFLVIGLEKIVGRNLAFINVTKDFILGNYCSKTVSLWCDYSTDYAAPMSRRRSWSPSSALISLLVTSSCST